jgi:4-oxalocrotonate tautomerase
MRDGMIALTSNTSIGSVPQKFEGEELMPHLTVKLWPGKTEQQKKKLGKEIVKAVTSTLSCAEESISVGIQEVKANDWTEQVYKPDILAKRDTKYLNIKSQDTNASALCPAGRTGKSGQRES